MDVGESDAAVIARSVGDPEVFRCVFDRHFEAILRYCRRRAGQDGDDVASDVFVKAFDLRGRYDLSRPDAGPWLYGIASNLLRGRWRGEVRRLRATARLALESSSWTDPDPSSRLDAARARPQIAAALAALSRDDRDTFLLNVWGGLGYEEVAVALGIPVGTVRSRVNRARTQVRSRLVLDGPVESFQREEPCQK